MRVADYIMNRLVEAGVNHVYLVTGRGALYLTDALAKNQELTPVCMHHEQSASYAAVASAQRGDKIGACLVSTGCASTNAITGVLSAWQDCLPCIFISGQNTLSETTRYTGAGIRTYGQQEADIVSLVAPITKYARMITSADEIVDAMDSALAAALSGRKGPVWIDVPLNLQSALIEVPSDNRVDVSAVRACVATDAEVALVANAFKLAKRPVVLIGHGVRSAKAESQLRDFVERLDLPLTYTSSAPDVYGSCHARSIGSVGTMGCSRAGNFAVQNSDLLLVLGSRLNSLTTGTDFGQFARAAKLIAVDVDAVEFEKQMVRVDQLVIGDIRDFIGRLGQFDIPKTDPQWIERCQHWKRRFGDVEADFRCAERVDLYELVDCLSEVLPRPANIVTDSGLIEVIVPTNLRFDDAMRCIHPASQGSMGFALPAAIGAYLSSKELTLAVVGDGSIMMNLQELETIRHHRLPLKILVVNNNVYSIIRRRQRDLFRKRVVGVDPDTGVSCPDFRKVAECFDLRYLAINDSASMRDGLMEALAHPGSVLCEVMGRSDQGYIEMGQGRSSIDRRLVRRPLEDQAPFLDRGVFLSEMIVDPVNY